MMKQILYLGAILLSQAIYSQGIKMLNEHELQTDYTILRTALEEAHPGLYRYASKSEMDAHFDSVKKGLDAPMTEQEFYKELLPLISEIGCGHTKLHPEEDDGYMYYYNTASLFPLKLFFQDEKAYVVSSYDDSIDIAPGTEIISINGLTIKDIITKLLSNLFSDGRNMTFKYYELNRYFNALFSNLFLEEGNEHHEFRISYKEHDEVKIKVLQAVSYQKVKEMDVLHENKEPYRLEFKNGNTALLTIRTFWPDDEKYDFDGFLKESFKTINEKNIENMIIDVRGNEGGKDANGALLMSYLVDNEFRYYDKLLLTTNKRFSFAADAQLPEQYDQLRGLITETDNGEYRWEQFETTNIQSPQAQPFKGNLFVLIDGASFSVSAEFAAVAHHLKRATFIGEETGGTYYGNNSGGFAIVTLPNSKLKLGIPLMAYYTAVDGYEFKDRGMIPDYELRHTIEEVLTEEDEVLERAMLIVNENTGLPQSAAKTGSKLRK